MLTQQDTGPEALEVWAQRNDVTGEALRRALERMAEESIECLLVAISGKDRGDSQSTVDICCNRQDLKNYFIEQICFIPLIHQYIGAVVGPNSDGVTPLYRQARICPWAKSAVLPWQNPDWVFALWEDYFLSRHTEFAEERLCRQDTIR